MVGLPKWIIKKYGVSKKAWAVFRGKVRKHTVRYAINRRLVRKTRHKRGVVMARYRRRSGGGLGGFGRFVRIPHNPKQLVNAAIGGVIGGLVGEIVASQVMPEQQKLAGLAGAAYGGGLGGVASHVILTPKVAGILQ